MFLDNIPIFFNKIQFFLNNWWPLLNFFNDVFFLQFFIIICLVYLVNYTSIYYVLLYTFVIFFLMGITLSIFQIELFTAFLWLIECSVLFVFLLLLFYLNVKNVYSLSSKPYYVYTGVFIFVLYLLFILCIDSGVIMSLYHVLDNIYEAIFNQIQNDLFVFSVSYFTINIIEFLLIGFLLLIGSIVCVNLYQFNKNVRVQNYNSFLNTFNFFSDFVGFLFFRKQSLVKQGNTKPSLKIFKKK